MTRIEDIKARVDAATEGPWFCSERVVDGEDWVEYYINTKHDSFKPVIGAMYDFIPSNEKKIEMWNGKNNVSFTTHSRQDVPWLLSMLSEAVSAITNLEDMGCIDILGQLAARVESKETK